MVLKVHLILFKVHQAVLTVILEKAGPPADEEAGEIDEQTSFREESAPG